MTKKPKVAKNDSVIEDLKYPWVHYPDSYGVFFKFSATENGKQYLCSCSLAAMKNYIDLQKSDDAIQNNGITSMGRYFSGISDKKVITSLDQILDIYPVEEGICHRCNLATPSLRYCVEMYGGTFKQYFGWYIKQTFLRMGIRPMSGLSKPFMFNHFRMERVPNRSLNKRDTLTTTDSNFLQALTPQPIIEKFVAIRENFLNANEIVFNLPTEHDEWSLEETRFVINAEETLRQSNSDLNKQKFNEILENKIKEHKIQWIRNKYWYLVASRMDEIKSQIHKYRREIYNTVEDITREEFGVKRIGQKWISESVLALIVERIFTDYKIIRHHRPDWLEGLELDIHIPDLAIAFEYQGQQHYQSIDIWGGDDALRKQKQRDKRKAQICRNMNIRLVSISYKEPLTEEHIRQRIAKS